MSIEADGYDCGMLITVLGSGTSQGVPMIGCDCAVCHSSDPRNRRYRSCLHVTADDGFSVLVDTPPEMRLAAIEQNIRRVDAVLFTHSHADHIFGLDDLRTFNWIQDKEIPLYAEPDVLGDIERSFSYIWRETQAGGGKPRLTLNTIHAGQPFSVGSLAVEPLRILHGSLPVLAYVFGGRVAYLTDVSDIPDDTFRSIEGIEILLLDAVRRKPHPTHFHFEKAIEVARTLGAKQTYFVHLSHDYDHEMTERELPPGISLAYDGLKITV
jgi:phosphoribosyl 1,2-cyclic phosphate phosphodiesterase